MRSIKVLLLCCLSLTCDLFLSAQSSKPFTVDTAFLAYKHDGNDSLLLHHADPLNLYDTVRIMNNGLLKLVKSEVEYGPRSKKTVKDLFYSNKIGRISKTCSQFFRGRLRTSRVVGFNAVHIHPVNGAEDDVKDGLEVAFLCNGKRVASFSELPAYQHFDFVLTNMSDEVQVYSIVFNYKSKGEDDYTSVIVDCLESKDSDSPTPIVLAPSETIQVRSSFYKIAGYFPYRLNIYGATDYFIMRSDSRSLNGVSVYAEKDFVSQQVPIDRFYFEYQDE